MITEEQAKELLDALPEDAVNAGRKSMEELNKKSEEAVMLVMEAYGSQDKERDFVDFRKFIAIDVSDVEQRPEEELRLILDNRAAKKKDKANK